MGGKHQGGKLHLILPLFVLAVVAAAVAVVALRVDFKPKVESDFFFSTDDPQLRASLQIEELFPTAPQVLIGATGEEVFGGEYLERLRALSDELAQLDGVTGVRSLTHGPDEPAEVPERPMWRRLLLGENPHFSQLIVSLKSNAGSATLGAIEEVVTRHSSPGFALQISGVPYVVELIRRHLARDLRVFSAAALAIFGLLIAAIYRSLVIVVGTLVTCLGACAVTLALLYFAGSSIGILTANLVTIVFVLTLSHIVFLTASWRREQAADGDGDGGDVVRRAVRSTFAASFWCMTTTLLGFTSLLLASAQPLRELGFAGAVGAAVAIAVAYGLYPACLRLLASRDGGRFAQAPDSRAFPLATGRRGVAAAVLVTTALLTTVAAFGVPRIDTDPGLLSYFAEDGELRAGIELIDRNGGSSPFMLVVKDESGQRLDDKAVRERLDRVQAAFDQDPAVGSALSTSVLIAEARKAPLAFLLPDGKLLDVLDTPKYGHVTRTFLTPDRTRTLFFLRMRESGREEPRQAVVERLTRAVTDAGFEVELAGGLYPLQGELGRLVEHSLVLGLGGLLVLFVGIAAVVSRSLRVTAAMVVSLAAVPVLLLGTFGLTGQPLDVITSPAANVAIGLGIDSMIHLVSAVRRHRRKGEEGPAAWTKARDELWQPILGATLILAAGFGIFALSSFPPTQRFGVAVAGGTVAAGLMALLVLPYLGGSRPAASAAD